MLTEIDHVAIAVSDLDQAVNFYKANFNAEVVHEEVIESDGVREALIKVADSYIQLLTPIAENSPVKKFLEKRGEGIHHVGYRVESAKDALERLKLNGVKVIDQEPRRGSRNTTVAFVHPAGAFGTLIELVEE